MIQFSLLRRPLVARVLASAALLLLPAMGLASSARVVKADEAKEIGLLNRLVPCAHLRDTAIELARAIGANNQRSVQGIKRLLHQNIGKPWRETYDIERAARGSWLKASNPAEAFKDFLNRKS